jgi:thiamine transport system substrate-binding protein
LPQKAPQPLSATPPAWLFYLLKRIAVMKRRSLAGLALAALAALPVTVMAADAPTPLRVITHSSFDMPKELLAKFEADAGVKLTLIKGGDAGEMLNKLILSKEAPIADVVFGIDNAMLPRARKAGVLAPLPASLLALPLSAQVKAVDPQATAATDWLPIDYGFVTLNIDKAWFAANKVALPTQLSQLAEPTYAKLLVVQNPATSSPGLAFLSATVQSQGAGVWAWWKALRANGVKVSSSWSDAYYKDFTRNGGTRPMVVSYLTSPAAEVFYSDKPLTESPTANLNLNGGVYAQVEGIALVEGGPANTATTQAAVAFMRFMRSAEAQTALQTTMWMWPVSNATPLAAVMTHAGTAPTVKAVDADVLARDSREWIRQFNQIVVR